MPGQVGQSLVAPAAHQAAQWAPLQAWCFRGAGDGSSPLLKPAQVPQMDQKFSVGLWSAPDHLGHGVVEAFSRHLDGSHQLLAAGGAWAGLLLRLRVKVGDVAWWRRRLPSDPWDCGYALNEPEARKALAQFEPRRATLVVSVDWPEAALIDAVTGMARLSSRYLHPVRWLVVQPNPCDPSISVERLRAIGLNVQLLQPPAADF
jgi:hypothetical protein